MEEWIWGMLLVHFPGKISLQRLGPYTAFQLGESKSFKGLGTGQMDPSWNLRSHPRDSFKLGTACISIDGDGHNSSGIIHKNDPLGVL